MVHWIISFALGLLLTVAIGILPGLALAIDAFGWPRVKAALLGRPPE